MKIKQLFITSFFLFGIIYSVTAQSPEQKIADHVTVLKDNNSFSILDSILKDKRIVILGEANHISGKTFETKVNLIKYLQKKLGFNVIGLENLTFFEGTIYP